MYQKELLDQKHICTLFKINNNIRNISLLASSGIGLDRDKGIVSQVITLT